MIKHPTAIIVIGHGTSSRAGVSQFFDWVATIQSRDPARTYYAGFMELAEPNIEDAIAQAVRDGHRDLLCQPVLLLAAGHAKNDFPAMIHHIAAKHHGVTVRYGSPLQLTAEIVALCARHVCDAAAGLDLNHCTLLVVGRGTSDPDANSNVSKLARMLEEGLGFAASSVCYFSTTRPRLANGLDQVASRAEGPVVVFPFILFAGFLDSMLTTELVRVQACYPAVKFVRSAPFGAAPGFAEAFIDRTQQSLEGGAEMPCLLCKYRSPMPGWEHEVALPPASSHHHSHHGHDHGHDNGHDHGHDHGHDP
ncbi:MAG: hypothetical protein RLZZ282_69, partial [Verrucomicrobiota bacterium]